MFHLLTNALKLTLSLKVNNLQDVSRMPKMRSFLSARKTMQINLYSIPFAQSNAFANFWFSSDFYLWLATVHPFTTNLFVLPQCAGYACAAENTLEPP